MSPAARKDRLAPRTRAFYRRGLTALRAAQVAFLVGGAYALERYTGIARYTKDLDIFVLPRDRDRALQVLAAAGSHVDLTYPHWLAKAFCGEDFIDIIFSSGNALCRVDAEWFAHAVKRVVLGVPVSLCPPEELIWSKAFVAERERYDGADIAHMLRSCGEHLAWLRLLRRFDRHWRVLLSHLILFGFVYPSERGKIPAWVMRELLHRLHDESYAPPLTDRVCQGTLLSRTQYLVDITHWGYSDGRLLPRGPMTAADEKP